MNDAPDQGDVVENVITGNHYEVVCLTGFEVVLSGRDSASAVTKAVDVRRFANGPYQIETS